MPVGAGVADEGGPEAGVGEAGGEVGEGEVEEEGAVGGRDRQGTEIARMTRRGFQLTAPPPAARAGTCPFNLLAYIYILYVCLCMYTQFVNEMFAIQYIFIYVCVCVNDYRRKKQCWVLATASMFKIILLLIYHAPLRPALHHCREPTAAALRSPRIYQFH